MFKVYEQSNEYNFARIEQTSKKSRDMLVEIFQLKVIHETHAEEFF